MIDLVQCGALSHFVGVPVDRLILTVIRVLGTRPLLLLAIECSIARKKVERQND